jgi:hypothetical protein
VPTGTDTFVRNFADKTCRNIIDDVEKLDVIQDHIMLSNRCVLHQQDVDCKIGSKIADTLLKQGTTAHNLPMMIGTRLGRFGYTLYFISHIPRVVLV